MRALAIAEDGGLAIVERADPSPGPDDVVIGIARAGICGSDVHLLGSSMLPAGSVMGHEIAGEVVAVGRNAPSSLIGRRVAVMPATRCGGCACCTAGRSVFLCDEQPSRWLGLGVHDGGYGEYLRAPAASVHRCAEGLPAEAAALIEPYAVALHAVRRSRAARDPALDVAVVGGGAIGLMTAAALLDAGVERLALAEPTPVRGEIARRMGVPHVVSDLAALPDALGGAPTLIFDCSGAPAPPGAAVSVVGAGGEIVLVGVVSRGTAIPMPGAAWVCKEVDVLTSIAYTEAEFADAASAVGRGAAKHDAVVTSVRPLEEGPAAFAALLATGAPAKVQLAPGGVSW